MFLFSAFLPSLIILPSLENITFCNNDLQIQPDNHSDLRKSRSVLLLLRGTKLFSSPSIAPFSACGIKGETVLTIQDSSFGFLLQIFLISTTLS